MRLLSLCAGFKQSIDQFLAITPCHWVLLRFPDPTAFATLSPAAGTPDKACFILITAAIVKATPPKPAAP